MAFIAQINGVTVIVGISNRKQARKAWDWSRWKQA